MKVNNKKLKKPDGWVGQGEWDEARAIVEDWIKNQLRAEGWDGIYIDDVAMLVHSISTALLKAKKRWP